MPMASHVLSPPHAGPRLTTRIGHTARAYTAGTTRSRQSDGHAISGLPGESYLYRIFKAAFRERKTYDQHEENLPTASNHGIDPGLASVACRRRAPLELLRRYGSATMVGIGGRLQGMRTGQVAVAYRYPRRRRQKGRTAHHRIRLQTVAAHDH